jgi:predicted ATP-grasp superfamily ATP-dependent carboligase
MNFPDIKIIECIADKYKQYELAFNAGIPVPETFCVSTMDQLQNIKNQIPLPAFIKGVDVTVWREKIGSAIKGFTVHDQKELFTTCRMIFEQGVTGLIQELIEGPDTCHYKASCYISRKGEVLLAFGLQKLRQQPVNYGFGCLVQSVEYPELLELGKTLFLKIGYRGVGSAEFKLDKKDNKLKLIELNPRYWQQNGLSEKSGMNFPLMNYLDLTGQDPDPIFDYRQGIKWVNIYSDFDSFREYRHRGQLSAIQWLHSLRGEKMLSDLSSDDILPGFHEMFLENILCRSGRYTIKMLKSRFST